LIASLGVWLEHWLPLAVPPTPTNSSPPLPITVPTSTPLVKAVPPLPTVVDTAFAAM